MKVLYHHRTAGDRVERVHIMGIVDAMRALGHPVTIVSPPGCDPELKGRTSTLRQAAASGDDLAVGLRARLKAFARKAPPLFFELFELAYNGYSLAAMLARCHGRRPDLIYERTTANSVAPTLLGRLLRVPVVQEVNVTADVGRLRPLVLGRLTRALERWCFANAATLVTVSRPFRQLLIDARLPGSENALVSPNAVSPAVFRPDGPLPADHAALRPPGIMLIGYVGAFVPYHGLETLAAVAPRLRERYPQWRWLLVGDGVMRAPLEAQITERGVRDVFLLPGSVRYEQVPGYVRLMDVCVMPHSNRHGSPMKIFEYMALGKPVLAPRLGPVAEIIRDGDNGLLFDPDDHDEFVAKLTQLLDDPDLRARLGERGRRHVLAHHTWEANVRQLFNHLARAGRLPASVAAPCATGASP